MTDFFKDVPEEPPNVILGVNLECRADPFPDKINLTVGAYRTDDGATYVLPCVRDAEEHILRAHLDHEYLVQDGLPEFNRCAQLLMFGEDSKAIQEQRVYTMQAVAGTAAVRLGTELCHKLFPRRKVYIPDVTWPNHISICHATGVPMGTYHYLDVSGVDFDFEGMILSLKNAEENSIVLFHSCAHNPTGVDPTDEQWQAILEIVKSRNLLPFFDNAYQGFVSGDPTTDAYAVRLFAEAGLDMIVACSFSKNFGLYGERVGALHVLVHSKHEVPRVATVCRALSRPLYSTCPSHGARIVAYVLSDPQRAAVWREQCAAMANRLTEIRHVLRNKLVAKNVRGTWDHIVKQRGMFSFSGIPAAQVIQLKKEHHIYFLTDGRISLAGLNSHNVDRFVDALAAVLGTNE